MKKYWKLSSKELIKMLSNNHSSSYIDIDIATENAKIMSVLTARFQVILNEVNNENFNDLLKGEFINE